MAGRDRFLLSAGHGSMLLYSLLHLTGYDLPLEELKNFRQWDSKTPGHPENILTPGVEITTGPLGQGFANGVGMAMGAAHLAAKFNREGFPLVDHYIYAIVSDGDLMEGVASEAASLAGHLKLGKLIYLYDDNHVTIEGFTSLAFSEDVPKRFESYGWHTSTVEDGNDLDAIEKRYQRSAGRRASVAHLGQDGHRLRDADRRDAQGALGRARRRGRQGDQARARLARRQGVLHPRRGARAVSRGGRARRAS